MFSNYEIEKYYDLSESHYRLFWDLNKSNALHYGLWDDSTKNFREALVNTNKKLSELANLKAGEKVLDAGCGVGGSSIWLAAEKACKVNGISLSKKQTEKANVLAKEAGLSEHAQFEVMDYTQTSFPNEAFNAVWAIESVCHANDKSQFTNEAYRLLKKDGRLVMADFFKKEGLQGNDATIVQNWAHGWAIPDFSTIEHFYSQLEAAGFKDIRIIDATEAITPSARRLYYAYFPGVIGAKIYKFFNSKATDVGRKNVNTAYWQWKALKKGLWSYKIIVAYKNTA